ncbi:MAG: hypothetical protein ACOCM7_04980, partial [Bacteroidales bacterium]
RSAGLNQYRQSLTGRFAKRPYWRRSVSVYPKRSKRFLCFLSKTVLSSFIPPINKDKPRETYI